MADIQATSEVIKWIVNSITLILMVLASWFAINKNNNLVLGFIILGNLTVYYFTQSPLLCWVISITGIVWIMNQKEVKITKQNLKSPKTHK